MKNWRLMETMIVKKSLKAELSIITKIPAYVKIDSQRLLYEGEMHLSAIKTLL